MDSNSIIKRIKSHKVVSFDIFDTLLKRDAYKPTDVFRIVEQESKSRFGIDSDFKSIRIGAERKARERSPFSEITLDEIYDEISIKDKNKFKELELEVESKILHCNYAIKSIYDYCVDSGKDIYIISDMYLPKVFLDRVLKREGFNGYKGILISCDYRKTKRSGELFKAFLDENEIKSEDVIHFGDSRYADYIGAHKAKISSIHIPRLYKHTLYMSVPDKKSGFEQRSLFAFINNRVGSLSNREERLGYEVLGPILYAYCRWIRDEYERVKTSNSRLWFAARDMYLFKQAFEIIYGDFGIDYMYISRRSLRPVLTYTTGKITESGKVFARGMYSIEEIVGKMGYDVTDLTKSDFDRSAKYNIRSLEEYPEVNSLLSSQRILDREHELAKNGIEYLENKGLVDSKIILADVGWHGTTQYILKRIQKSLSEKATLFGLYLGCLDSTNERIGKDNYKVFAFSEDKTSDFAKGILLFESLILAPHGSTIYYKTNNGVIEPVLGDPDNVSDFLVSVQKGALEFVNDLKGSILGNNIKLSSEIVTKAFCSLAISPRKEELQAIANLDYDDFGIEKMAAPKALTHYLKNPRLLYHDLKYSPWRVGFLYKLFKIRLPYGRIYSFLRRGGYKQGNLIIIKSSSLEDQCRNNMLIVSALGVA